MSHVLSTQSSVLSTFPLWICHRARVVGLSWPDGVADAAGLPASQLTALGTTGNIATLSRSARGYLARALRISVRELEALADGRLGWIDDARVFHVDRYSGDINRGAASAISYPSSSGVPILGRILEDGHVEHNENWTPQEGRRLSVRYRDMPDAFALELLCDTPVCPAGGILVFQPVVPGELCDADLAVITCEPMDSETLLCAVSVHAPMTLGLRVATGEQCELLFVQRGNILRAARMIDVRQPMT